MPRIARLVGTGYPHHVIQRGNNKEREEELEKIRTKTRLGKPLGGDDFIKELSRKLGRSLIFRPKGRPVKKKEQ